MTTARLKTEAGAMTSAGCGRLLPDSSKTTDLTEMTVLQKKLSRARARFVVHRRSSVTALLPVSDQGYDEKNKKNTYAYMVLGTSHVTVNDKNKELDYALQEKHLLEVRKQQRF